MKPTSYAVTVAGGIWLATCSLALGQGLTTSNQELIDRLAQGHGDVPAAHAFKMLHTRLHDAGTKEADAIRSSLLARLATTTTPSGVRKLALVLACAPTPAVTTAIVERLDAAGPVERIGLCDALCTALSRLTAGERKALSPSVTPRMLEIIEKPACPQVLACRAASCLGALGNDGYPVLKRIIDEPALRAKVADSLAWTLAQTRDARALGCIVKLCDDAEYKGRRIAAVHAIGSLICTLRKDATAIPADTYQAALGRVYQYLRSDGDPELFVVAIRAAGFAVGVDHDQGLRQVVVAALSHPDPYVRTAAYDVLMGTQTARSSEVKQMVAQLQKSETEPVARAGAEAVLGAAEAEE